MGNNESGDKIHEQPRCNAQIEPSFPAEVKPYRPAKIRVQGETEDFYSVPPKSLAAIVIQIVEQEGPIMEDIIANRVAEAWGIARVGTRIRRIVERAVQIACANKTLVRDEDAFRLRKMTNIPIRKNNGQQSRDIEKIPMIEIAAAIRLCLREAVSIDETELVATVAILFGFQRTGPKIQKRILKAIDLLESKSEAIRDGNVVRVGTLPNRNMQEGSNGI